MDLVIKRAAEHFCFISALVIIFLIKGSESQVSSIKCIEHGRFYRNPKPSSTNSDFLFTLEECSKYYLCLEGEVFEFVCSSGLAFDIDKQVCVNRNKVTNCDRFAENTVQKTTNNREDNEHTGCEKPNYKKCSDNNTCIPSDYFCDGSLDCPDGSDEVSCDPNEDPKGAPPCDPDSCRLPKCFCSINGTAIPANLRENEVPQMVLLTFEDAVNEDNIDIYNILFGGKYANPNDCPIPATFFISHPYNNYFFTEMLWNRGHEIAVHSITHRTPEEWWSINATVEDWFDEMVGQANILNKFSNIKLSEIKGLRVPFLRIGWNRQFLMMKEFGFMYDSSIVAPYSHIPLWPYTLDYKMPHKCFRQMCPSRSYQGLWQMVINQLEASDISCATLDSCPDLTGEEMYNTLIRNFNRHYSTNKAPFGIHLQASWFDNNEYLKAFQDFLDHVLSKPDVWFVTNSQAIEWIQRPIPLKKLLHFRPWDCRIKPKEYSCEKPNSCTLFSRALKEEIYLQTCGECPKKYPWIKNEFGME